MSEQNPILEYRLKPKMYSSATLPSTQPSPANVPSVQNTSTQSFNSQEECTLFSMLPIKIRNEIYKLLLVHPALGECVVNKAWLVTRPRSYGLCPAILRTCQKINHEAETILYGTTTFSMVCAPTLISRGKEVKGDHMSPLTRHMAPEPAIFLRDHPGVKKVQKWRVVISTFESNRNPLQDVTSFCRAIVHSPRLQSLEVIIIPVGLEAANSKHKHNQNTFCNLLDLLKPFKTLRNVGSFTIRPADIREFSKSVLERLDPISHGYFDCARLEATHRPLIQGNTVVEHTFEMYHSLLSYTRAFESCETFRGEMVSN